MFGCISAFWTFKEIQENINVHSFPSAIRHGSIYGFKVLSSVLSYEVAVKRFILRFKKAPEWGELHSSQCCWCGLLLWHSFELTCRALLMDTSNFTHWNRGNEGLTQKHWKISVPLQCYWLMLTDKGQTDKRQTGKQADKRAGRLTERQTDWLTERQTDWQIGRQTDWKTDRLADWQTDWQTDTYRKTDKLTDRQAGRHIHRQTHVQKDRQVDRQTYRKTDKLTDRQTEMQAGRQLDSLIDWFMIVW